MASSSAARTACRRCVTADWRAVEGNLRQRRSMRCRPFGAGRAFLNDIAHNAAPGEYVDHAATWRRRRSPRRRRPTPTPPPATRSCPNMFGGNATYDNELLDRHFIVGDGRGNENIALTAVHHRSSTASTTARSTQIKATLLAGGDARLPERMAARSMSTRRSPQPRWRRSTRLVTGTASACSRRRASRTEMVYQHLVFEEFVRAVAPQIDPFVFSNTVEHRRRHLRASSPRSSTASATPC